LGSGWLRPAPGTWGSLAGLLAWCLFTCTVTTPFLSWAVPNGNRPLASFLGVAMEGLFLLVIGLLTWVSVRASDHVVRETGEKDPGYVVADEWVGIWVTLWPLRWVVGREAHRFFEPGGWRWMSLLVLPFLVFRVLDIWKPWPVDQLQELPAGQGVVADDLVAGLYGLPIVVLTAPWLVAWASR
jgi:phosphatidylglycerophosphatase A